MAAVALLPRQGAEFTALLKGAAGKALTDSPVATNETFGLETFAMAAAVAAWGEQSMGGGNDSLRGQRRRGRSTNTGALQDSGDLIVYRKFLIMRNAAVGITLRRTRVVKGVSGG